jgi:hypothetical protein
MAMIAPAKQGQTEYKLIPAGTHIARIDQIIDLGVHTTTYKDKQGNNKQAHRVSIRFEVPSQKLDDGSPMTIYKDFNFSLGTVDGKFKSDLRKNIEAILGKDLTSSEVQNFDIEQLVGQVAMIQVAHVPGVKDPTKKYASVTGMMQAPAGLPIPEPFNKPVVFSTASFDQEIFDLLPEWVQKKIALPPGIDVSASANDEDQDASKLLA